MSDIKYEYGCEVTSTKECPLNEEIRADERAKTIEEYRNKMKEIIDGEDFTDWQKYEILECNDIVAEELKEQSNGNDRD